MSEGLHHEFPAVLQGTTGTSYVCGFLFDNFLDRVLLVLKEKPRWQAGLINGIGGKVECGELPLEAMHREFKEECGLAVPDWFEFARYTGDWGAVHFFTARVDNAVFDTWQQCETERIVPLKVDDLLTSPHIPNLRWLVPMARFIDNERLCLQFSDLPEGAAV